MLLRDIIENKKTVYIIGIKGTGTCALAELLQKRGARVSGSDTENVFYTDAVLKEIGIPYYESFKAAHIPPDAALVVYSAAYTPETNEEMRQARALGVPMLKYTDALGEYSALFNSAGITGVHGKTTTTALAGTLCAALNLPVNVLAGSAVKSFGGRSTVSVGDKYFIAETCEYRKHFLSFHPTRIVLTSVESDHQDFYPTYRLILGAFLEYIRKLPEGGALIYCVDDSGAYEAAEIIKGEGKAIRFIPYGFSAEGAYKIENHKSGGGFSSFKLAGFDTEWKLKIAGRHNVLNSAAAIALAIDLAEEEARCSAAFQINTALLEKMSLALADFQGSKRRGEILGEAGGVLFMDDYGHHPTAIKTTLAGIKDFYPGRRLVVSFMSHTYTRTVALFEEFASAFERADVLVLHKIYSSAREVYKGGVNGRTLFERARELRGDDDERTFYIEEPLDAVPLLIERLKAGDIFLTLGAGDNFIVSEKLFDYFNNKYSENKSGADK